MKYIKKLDLRRIAIFGGSGSGKSLLAMKLGTILNLSPIHIDDLYHGPNWTELPPNKLVQRVNRRIESEKWIIDGNYAKVRPYIVKRSTLIIIIRIPLLHQLKQLFVRTLGRAFGVNSTNITPLPKEVEKSQAKENPIQALYMLGYYSIKFHLSKYYQIREEISQLESKPQVVTLHSNAQRDHFIKKVNMSF